MSEITTDTDFRWSSDYYNKDFLKEPSEDWEALGCMAFASAAFVALSAYVPAALKKNRTYTVGPLPNHLGPSVPQLAQVIEPVREEANAPQVGYACSPTDRAKIVHLFTSLADATPWDLVWRGLELTRLGTEIYHVHPLAVLTTAPKHKMHQMLTGGNPLKINSFMEKMAIGLSQEYIKGNLVPHIETFAQEVQKNEGQIRQLIQAQDWENLVYYLYDVRA